MVRSAQIHLTSLRSCLINLPLSIYAPLIERSSSITPQSLVIQLSFTPSPSNSSAPTPSSASSANITGKATSSKLVKVYVGWTGLPSDVVGVSSNQVRGGKGDLERIDIDPQFAAMLSPGLTEGVPVSIELLRDLPVAASVSVTPLTADDWEILETNAEFIETNLLNQVRAVAEGMTIGCWVGGTTLVRFKVDATTPSASPALLLTSDTELIVAPKTRNAVAPPATHDLSASSDDVSTATSPEWDQLRRQLVRLLPCTLQPANYDALVDLDTAFVSPTTYHRFKAALPSLRCTVSHRLRPTIKAAAAHSDREKEKERERSNGASDKEVSKSSSIEVRITQGSDVADGHIWINEKLRVEIGLSDESNFELLKFSAPLTGAAKRLKEAQKEKALMSPIADQSTLRATPSRVSSSLASTSKEIILPSSASLPPSLAGVEVQLESIRSHVVNSLAAKQLGSARTEAPGILVTGASGAGKTSLMNQICRELGSNPSALTHTIYVDCSKLSDERLPVLKGRMKDWFDEACWHAPSLLVLDNLDRLIGAEVEHADSFPALHLAHTFLATALSALASRPVILLASAQSSASLHPLLSSTHLLGETVSLRGPSKTGRRDIVASLVKAKIATSSLLATSLNCAAVAAQTEGYLPADLRDLIDRAIHQAAIRSSAHSESLDLSLDDFTAAQIGFVPLSLRDVKLQKSDVQWADIGGLHETRRVLRETLEWPTKYGAIFANCPLRLRSGLLLYGFPGCGKTLLASAVAKECGLNFISVKGPEILNKYIGASEKSVRDLFERASAAKPCILFFDEFDSIAPKRGHDSTGVTDRVVNQMLTQMDGAEGLDGVYVLAATSRPDLIDPALLRPGRLDKSLLCDMPSYDDRLEIMEACSRKIALDPSIDLNDYAGSTAGFSGADLQALMYNAHLDAIHTTLSSLTSEGGDASASNGNTVEKDLVYTSFGGTQLDEKVLSRAEQATVTKRLELILGNIAKEQSDSSIQSVATESSRKITHVKSSHLQKSLKSTRPSVPAEELVRLRKIYSEFVSGRSAAGLPSGTASDEVGGRSSLM